jgi:nitrous oxide reductase accessory protein NosL
MKNLILVLLFLSASIFAQEKKFVKNVETENAVILQTGDARDWCSVCGMNLKMFYKTNHAAELNDGNYKQYCSIHCLLSDEHNHKDNIKNIFVVDANSEKIINTKNAFYVVGSDVQGTMSPISKIAFSSKSDAEEFNIAFNGNSILNFKEVTDLVRNKLSEETQMLVKRKEMKIYPKGEKLFLKLCNKDIELNSFSNIAELKANIKFNNLCKNLDEQQLQMIALYLWDVKFKEAPVKSKISQIAVPENAKCPVCGMFVYKYPRWAAVIKIDNKNLYFDGVKDLMKFYFEPEKWSDFKNLDSGEIIVTEYYSQQAIDGKDAIYVIESDVFGPMGNELIPFSNKLSAISFMKDHGGQIIPKFNQITKEIISKLDE